MTEPPKCKRCGTPFVRKRDWQRYCSPRCQLAQKTDMENAKRALWRAMGRPTVEEIEAGQREAAE